MRFISLSVVAVVACCSALPAQQVPRSIYTDPPRDSAHPAHMEVLHIPSGGVKINGVAYVASGAGMHPTFVFFHGLPGNEKNLDLAQAVRRAGWNAVTVNYRGSWGSPGQFKFGNNLEDAVAVMAFLRDPLNARNLGIDTTRMVMAGHSMGGWVTALTAARDRGLAGAILMSAADMGAVGKIPRADLIRSMADDMESLAGVTAEGMADELLANGMNWGFAGAATGLARLPVLVLSSDDGLAPGTDALVKAVRAAGNKRVTAVHQATDHSWSGKRIALESAVVTWLGHLR